jgi:hypothetical protein
VSNVLRSWAQTHLSTHSTRRRSASSPATSGSALRRPPAGRGRSIAVSGEAVAGVNSAYAVSGEAVVGVNALAGAGAPWTAPSEKMTRSITRPREASLIGCRPCHQPGRRARARRAIATSRLRFRAPLAVDARGSDGAGAIAAAAAQRARGAPMLARGTAALVEARAASCSRRARAHAAHGAPRSRRRVVVAACTQEAASTTLRCSRRHVFASAIVAAVVQRAPPALAADNALAVATFDQVEAFAKVCAFAALARTSG